MKDALLRLLAHMHWADDVLLDALHSAPPPADAVRWYAHVLAVENVWYLRLGGEDWKVQPVWPELTLEECAALARSNVGRLKSVVEALGDAGLARRITYVNSAGKTFTNTAADILLHVTLHGVHHRGQAVASLRRAGTAPPVLDYIHFMRESSV